MALLGASGAPIRFTSLSGEAVTLDLEEGELALVVHFWATWCPTCIAELRDLDSAAQNCEDSSVSVVTVNVGEDSEKVEAFAGELGLRLPVLRDPRGAVWRDLSGVGLPVNLIWTPGQRRIEVGPHDAVAWVETLRSLGCGKTPPETDSQPVESRSP